MPFRLLTAEAVRSRLELNDSPEVEALILKAIDATTPRFEAVLQTRFAQGEQEDYFFLDESKAVAVGSLYRLKLSRGFIREGTVSLYAGDDLAGVQSVAVTEDLTKTFMAFEGGLNDKGFLLVSDTYKNQYLKVKYTYGFGEGDALPAWLTECAFFYVFKMLSLSNTTEIKGALEQALKMTGWHGVEILDANLRTMPNSVRRIV